MLRRVEEEDARVVIAVIAGEVGHVGAGIRLARIDGERAVAEQRVDVVVAAEHPALELRVVVHGLALAKRVERWLWVAAEGGVERGEGDA